MQGQIQGIGVCMCVYTYNLTLNCKAALRMGPVWVHVHAKQQREKIRKLPKPQGQDFNRLLDSSSPFLSPRMS